MGYRTLGSHLPTQKEVRASREEDRSKSTPASAEGNSLGKVLKFVWGFRNDAFRWKSESSIKKLILAPASYLPVGVFLAAQCVGVSRVGGGGRDVRSADGKPVKHWDPRDENGLRKQPTGFGIRGSA